MSNDLTEHFRLDTVFFPDHVEHMRYFASRHTGRQKTTEKWQLVSDIAKSQLGYVRLEQKMGSEAGHGNENLRAVNLVYKRMMPVMMDYRRELLAMSVLAKYTFAFVDFYGWFEDEQCLYIAMEYFEKGDLDSYIYSPSQQQYLPEIDAKTVAQQALEALRTMHQQGFVHRDLKPQNIFVVTTEPLWIKLGDFGISKRVRDCESTRLRTQAFTPGYVAPEVIYIDATRSSDTSSSYTKAVDLWSLGCVIYEVLMKSPLFPNMRHYHQFCDGKIGFPRDKLHARGVSNTGVAFIEALLVADPDKRINVSVAMEHPWLRSSDHHGVENKNSGTTDPLWIELQNETSTTTVHYATVHHTTAASSTVSSLPSDCGQPNMVSPAIGLLEGDTTSVSERVVMKERMMDDGTEGVAGKDIDHFLGSSAGLVAATYKDQGRWKEATELEKQIVEARKRVLGEEHPNTLSSMASLATTYYKQGRRKEAEELDLQVVEARKRVLGGEHPDTLFSIGNLASTYRKLGRFKEAEELLLQVLEARKRVLGEEHQDTLTSMGSLATTYYKQKRWKEAEKLFVRTMETQGRILGEDHPDTLTSTGNLAATYHKQGQWKEAEELFVRTMETQRRILGEEHPATLWGMGNLASAYRSQGQWKEAEKLYLQVVSARERVLGKEHPDTLTSVDSLGNLARTLAEEQRLQEAITIMEKVVELRRGILGELHPETVSSVQRLGIWTSQLECKFNYPAALTIAGG